MAETFVSERNLEFMLFDVFDLESLTKIPLEVGCSGSFSQLYDFLRELEGLPQTIWVEDLQLGKSAVNPKDVGCKLTLAVFTDNPGNSDQAERPE